MGEPIWPTDDRLFWEQVARDSERTVVCNPDMESRVKGNLDRLGADGVTVTVIVTRWCPEGSIYVLDENAINASLRQSMTRSLRPGRGVVW